MTDHRYQIAGWVLFILSAIGFTISSWRSGDPAALIGALLFLVACFVFLVPLLREPRSKP
jgi:hypothetical protein